MRHTNVAVLLIACVTCPLTASADNNAGGKSIFVWKGHAPGEKSLQTGELQPFRKSEKPPVTRVVKIRRPQLDVFLPNKPNGTAILILPGGGFIKVVPDKEGSEAAPFLNRLGIAVFVLRYRTNEVTPKEERPWKRPLQDAQRAMRLIRSRAAEWKINPKQVGVLGFSAGGQVAAILHTATGRAAYDERDSIDKLSYRPDFSLLIYPWQVYGRKNKSLLPEIKVTEKSPPAFIVHTHDDQSSSLGSVLIYVRLKQHGVSAELHVYENGGHGYGMRSVEGSNIGSWPQRAEEWLVRRGLGRKSK